MGGGHPPPGSGYPNSGPPTHGYPQIRKRASHSKSGLPVLPPKKQHMDMPDEFKYQKDAHAEDNGRRWQDEINSGFDRLVAYATEVDKRRRSTDSNSPVRPNSDVSSNDNDITNNSQPNANSAAP